MAGKTQKELARELGVTTRTIRNWVRAGMPRLSGGQGFDLNQVQAWRKTVKYCGASLRQMEADAQVNSLFESAVRELQRGLQHLCLAFTKARGVTRQHLIYGAVRGILRGTHIQKSLLEKKGGEAANSSRELTGE